MEETRAESQRDFPGGPQTTLQGTGSPAFRRDGAGAQEYSAISEVDERYGADAQGQLQRQAVPERGWGAQVHRTRHPQDIRGRWVGAVWVDSFGGFKYRVDYREGIVELSDAFRAIPEVITQRAGRGGCWDVYAWRGAPDELVFAESKRRGSDKLRASQLRWLQMAL